MKIKEIRISGFRGIPPVTPPDLDLKLTHASDQIRDVIIFGPNAYGKSSIADALEWFFREDVRGNNYFENYSPKDNVHLNLGKPDYPDKAYIELVLTHEGSDHTVRKVITATGDKAIAEEELAGLEPEIEKCRDEIIILDHDQFRQFVSAASKDKWTTFSSLIGYEELDYFRAGLDSLSQRSANDWFKLTQLKKELDREKKQWKQKLTQDLSRFGLPTQEASLTVLETEFMRELEVTLSSLSHEIPGSITEIDQSFWTELRQASRPPDIFIQSTERLRQLDKLANIVTPLTPDILDSLAKLVADVDSLAENKARFDKQLVAEFYAKGLAILAENKMETGKCPFCLSSFDWTQLQESVQTRLSDLQLDATQQKHKVIQQSWRILRQGVETKIRSVRAASLPTITQSCAQIPNPSTVAEGLALRSFDDTAIKQWKTAIMGFNEVLIEQANRIRIDKLALETTPAENPMSQLIADINHLFAIWEAWKDLNKQKERLQAKEHCHKIISDTIQQFRNIAKSFRDELNDFSGRVVQQINNDVNSYYDALHPDDGVKPFLTTEIVGNQRKVQLKCEYKGVPNREAATLLSESHRNSLGLAIMLAFMKYKRRTGSPIEFLILDDVTQSFDVGHRLGLLNFLSDPTFPEIYESQIIFLTHDRTLADLIVRPGEQDDNWLRYDIRSWQLNNIKVEPNDKDLFTRAQGHLTSGDSLAAAVYGRHALEFVYRSIVETANLLMPYNAKPWKTALHIYQKYITEKIQDLWEEDITVVGRQYKLGLINPDRIRIDQLNRSLRLLHLTVHDSDFLDNPPSHSEIDTAIQAVIALRDSFTCPHCRTNNRTVFFHKLQRDRQGNPPKCKKCRNALPADSP